MNTDDDIIQGPDPSTLSDAERARAIIILAAIRDQLTDACVAMEDFTEQRALAFAASAVSSLWVLCQAADLRARMSLDQLGGLDFEPDDGRSDA